MTVRQLRQENAIDLGFDPKCQTREVTTLSLTPKIAQYILDNHNFDNRLIKKNQVNNLAKNINEVGFLWDGGALTFNTDGNITEFQHRLITVVRLGITVLVPVILGVLVDTFTKGQEARKRTAGDEIQRKYPKAQSSEITTLGDVVGRKGLPKIKMSNAIEYWAIYSPIVKRGNIIVDDFFDSVSEYSPYRRNFASWASLMSEIGEEDAATQFLECLKDEILGQDSFTLTTDFFEFFKEQSWSMSNSGRATFMFQCLCVASDRFLKSNHANIQLKGNVSNFNHVSMKKAGVYRKFLVNQD
tara:strand:- start:48 stop:947 length:900 start_codon:yes stop_codon:yes gene_type:complete